jgi:ABC-type oligopeptide transport system substrate-binding subunit
MNDVGYHNPTYDALLAQATVTTDAAARGRLLGKAEHLLLDDAGVLPLNFPVNRAVVSPRIRGWRDNILNVHPSCFLTVGP